MPRSLFVFVIVFVLAGCAGRGSVSAKQCAVGDWETIGYRDGRVGAPRTRLLDHQEACMEHGLKPDRGAYLAGWKDGVREYCDPVNGFLLGERGHRHNNVCPADLRPGFLTAYQQGRDLYLARAGIAEIERRIDQKTARLDEIRSEIISATAAQIDSELTLEERVALADTTRRLVSEQERIDRELPTLKAELAERRRALDELTRSVRTFAPVAAVSGAGN